MSQTFQPYTPPRTAVSGAVDARARFIVRTYNHLFGAIVLFTLIEIGLFTSGMAEVIMQAMVGVSWLLVLGGFMLVSWLASRFAHTAESKPVQYMALGGFVVAEAIIFVPLLYIAQTRRAWRDSERRARHDGRLWRTDRRRVHHPKGLFVPRRDPASGPASARCC